MKRFRFLTVIVLAVVLAFTLITPVSVLAEEEENEGQPLPSLTAASTYAIPKSMSHHGWCVTYSNYYMLLRKAVQLGSGMWYTINPVELRERTKKAKAYTFVRDGVTYSVGINWGTLKGKSTAARGEFLKAMLKDHPEGIVIYGHHSQKDRDAHAVLLVGYDSNKGTFMVVDPVRNRSGRNVGIETIGSSTIGSLARITMFMYIKEYVGEVKTQMIPKLKPKHPLASEFNYPELMVEGTSYSIEGEVTSGNKLEEVVVQVVDAAGKAVQSKKVKPGTDSFYLQNLDEEIRFGDLKEGEYKYKVTAKDKNGEKTILNRDFTVMNKSALAIKDANHPKKIKNGSAFSVAGKVLSNYSLKNVTVAITDKAGNVVLSAKARMANTKSFNLKNLDSKLTFSKLKKGVYHYVVKAKNAKGVETLLNKKFTVE